MGRPPRFKARLRIGAADGEPVSAETFDALQSKLRVNGKIMLSLTRGDTNYAVELSSNTYTAVSVEGRMAGTVGILRIRNFDSETPAQFKTAYRSLLDQGAASLLFDLRDNEGGSSSRAVPPGRIPAYSRAELWKCRRSSLPTRRC